jgi:hypothetical protein
MRYMVQVRGREAFMKTGEECTDYHIIACYFNIFVKLTIYFHNDLNFI